MDISNKSIRDEFLSFQQYWHGDKLKNLTLEEYTGLVGKDGDNLFTYQIENKYRNFGNIHGGTSRKFGIYKPSRNNKDHSSNTDGVYNWNKRFGNDKDYAFEKIKKGIQQLKLLSENNNLKAIECLNEFANLCKWKIAFLYQQPDNMHIIPIYKKEIFYEWFERNKPSINYKNWKLSDFYEYLSKGCGYNFEKIYVLHREIFNTYLLVNQIEEDEQDLPFKERRELRQHKSLERHVATKLIKKVKKRSNYICSCCFFDFRKIYGEDYIEVHHKIPFSELKEGEEREVRESDLEAVCANCHRILHRTKMCKSIDELKIIIKNHKI